MENQFSAIRGGTPSRLSRLLQLLQLLSSGVERNSEEYSEILGVSRRTVFRDIETLAEAGVQVHFDGRSKVYRLKNTLKLRLRPRTSEILDLVVALTALKRLPIAAASVMAQIESTLSNELSPSSNGEFYNALNFVSWEKSTANDSIDREHLLRFFHGFTTRTRVRITYRTDRGPQGTLLSPLKLHVGNDLICISGWSSYHRNHAKFKVTEILSTESTCDSFGNAELNRSH